MIILALLWSSVAIEWLKKFLDEQGLSSTVGENIVQNDEEVVAWPRKDWELLDHTELKRVWLIEAGVESEHMVSHLRFMSFRIRQNNLNAGSNASCPVVLKLQYRIKIHLIRMNDFIFLRSHVMPEVIGLLVQNSKHSCSLPRISETRTCLIFQRTLTLYSQTTKRTE